MTSAEWRARRCLARRGESSAQLHVQRTPALTAQRPIRGKAQARNNIELASGA